MGSYPGARKLFRKKTIFSPEGSVPAPSGFSISRTGQREVGLMIIVGSEIITINDVSQRGCFVKKTVPGTSQTPSMIDRYWVWTTEG